jgi:hypothetical protein
VLVIVGGTQLDYDYEHAHEHAWGNGHSGRFASRMASAHIPAL